VELVSDDGTVKIVATDSGCGLPDADRSRLTEPYMTTRTKGTGLGLAIVNKVMEDHGGELWLEDAPQDEGWESGARVTLIFPKHRTKKESSRDAVAGHETEKPSKEAVNGV
jgi:two-component system nitrogen regulation sensor histidine kinase NtrY